MLDSIKMGEKSELVFCPDCGYPAKIIGRTVVGEHVEATTHECPNCHHFSKIVQFDNAVKNQTPFDQNKHSA